MFQILNCNDGDTFIYPLCIIKIAGLAGETIVSIRNITVNNSNCELFPVKNEAANALVLLILGKNKIEIRCGHKITNITLFYKYPEHSRTVRLLYLTCLDEEEFQGPLSMDKGVNEAVKRIQIGALLMQTFLAESLNEEGLGRKTFKLEMTKAGLPKVFVIQLPLKLEEVYKLSEQMIWETIAMHILSSPLASRSCKYLAFFCGTRFINNKKQILLQEKDILSMTKGHISLGGGGLAVVGTGAMYTWATSVNQILPNFRNMTKINTEELMDFSANRGTWGACYGTHLGSVLHELCHTFDLGHTRHGIMSRGFEDFHLYFTSTFIKKDDLQGCSNFNKKKVFSSITSSPLMKESQTFTTNFIRKNLENISMVVEPLKDSMASSVVYSPCITPKIFGEPIPVNDDRNGNHLVSPGFERFDSFNLCLIERIQGEQFEPKSPCSSSPKFLKSSLLQLKNCIPALDNNLNNISNNESLKIHRREVTNCKAFFARSNIVFLAYHKWLNEDASNDEDGKPELKGSVLRSDNGIRLVELRDSRMMAFYHWEYLNNPPPAIVHLPWAQVSQWPRDSSIDVVAIDNRGRVLKGCSIPRPL